MLEAVYDSRCWYAYWCKEECGYVLGPYDSRSSAEEAQPMDWDGWSKVGVQFGEYLDSGIAVKGVRRHVGWLKWGESNPPLPGDVVWLRSHDESQAAIRTVIRGKAGSYQDEYDLVCDPFVIRDSFSTECNMVTGNFVLLTVQTETLRNDQEEQVTVWERREEDDVKFTEYPLGVAGWTYIVEDISLWNTLSNSTEALQRHIAHFCHHQGLKRFCHYDRFSRTSAKAQPDDKLYVTCPACNGQGRVEHPAWQMFWEIFRDRGSTMSDGQIVIAMEKLGLASYIQVKRAEPYCSILVPPPKTLVCRCCQGRGSVLAANLEEEIEDDEF